MKRACQQRLLHNDREERKGNVNPPHLGKKRGGVCICRETDHLYCYAAYATEIPDVLCPDELSVYRIETLAQ